MEKEAIRKAIQSATVEQEGHDCRGREDGRQESHVCGGGAERQSSPAHRTRQMKVGKLLDLDKEHIGALSAFPVRTDFPNATDPFKYRLLEIIGVYGDSMREHGE